MRTIGLIIISAALFIIWRNGYASPLACTILFTAGYLIGWTAKGRPQ